jgi:hypothetical protein
MADGPPIFNGSDKSATDMAILERQDRAQNHQIDNTCATDSRHNRVIYHDTSTTDLATEAAMKVSRPLHPWSIQT